MGDQPSTVSFGPLELRPFELRYHFSYVTDDTGRKVLWLEGAETVLPEGVLANWTPQHERTRSENTFAHRRYAERLLTGRLRDAGAERSKMLTLASDESEHKLDQLDDLYLVALDHEVRARQEAGDHLIDIALDLGISRTTLWRRRDEAKRRGLALGSRQ